MCGAIFAAAGIEKLRAACERIGGCKTAEAVITPGFELKAKYIIHTPGPMWNGGNSGEQELLYRCYLNSLTLAEQYGCQSIAFPLISAGIYGYPKDKALRIAISAISEFLMKHEMDIYLVFFDKVSIEIGEKLFALIEDFIDDNYVAEHRLERRIEQQAYRQMSYLSTVLPQAAPDRRDKRSLEEAVGQLDESFSQMLLRMIDEKRMTDVQAYKRANIDRKLFSKIRSDRSYNPSKSTALAFAIALELTLYQTLELLGKAGYTLSHSSRFDLIIEYFITQGEYDIHAINQALFAFDQALLGA